MFCETGANMVISQKLPSIQLVLLWENHSVLKVFNHKAKIVKTLTFRFVSFSSLLCKHGYTWKQTWKNFYNIHTCIALSLMKMYFLLYFSLQNLNLHLLDKVLNAKVKLPSDVEQVNLSTFPVFSKQLSKKWWSGMKNNRMTVKSLHSTIYDNIC